MPTHLPSMREDVLKRETASFFTLHNLAADRCEIFSLSFLRKLSEKPEGHPRLLMPSSYFSSRSSEAHLDNLPHLARRDRGRAWLYTIFSERQLTEAGTFRASWNNLKRVCAPGNHCIPTGAPHVFSSSQPTCVCWELASQNLKTEHEFEAPHGRGEDLLLATANRDGVCARAGLITSLATTGVCARAGLTTFSATT